MYRLISMFSIYVLCLVYFFGTSNSQKAEELKFDVTHIGNKAILISWNPDVDKDKIDVKYHFIDEYVDGSCRKKSHRTYLIDKGQFVITGAAKNTVHNVTVERIIDDVVLKSYEFEIKVQDNPDEVPVKPDLHITKSKRPTSDLNANILWLPCGKGRYCNGKTPGSSFYVKYRIKNSPQFTIAKPIWTADYSVRSVLPGKVYEVVIVSVNGKHEIESDPHEFSFPAESGPVQEVNFLQLGRFKGLLSWKPPAQPSNEIVDYRIAFSEFEDAEFPTYFKYERKIASQLDDGWRIILDSLSVNTNYTILIIPRMNNSLGTEYRFGVAITDNKFPLANPDFTYEIVLGAVNKPKLLVRWFPCGLTNECRNQRAGSAFFVYYRQEGEVGLIKHFIENEDYAYIDDIQPNTKYEIKVQSLDKLDEKSDIAVKNIQIPAFDTIEVELYSSLVIPCKVPASANKTIRWLLNGLQLPENDKVQKMENGDLRFKAVDLSHRGKYVCWDQNGSFNTNVTTYLQPYTTLNTTQWQSDDE